MFARMTFLQVKTENIEEGIRIFRTSVFPAAKQQKGFRGACLLVDRVAGKGVAVTFWKSEKDLCASEENRHYQDQLLKGLHLYIGPPIREDYEVSIHNLTRPAKKTVRKRAPKKKKSKK
jgi:heme-degrading monooxygenase HmoA